MGLLDGKVAIVTGAGGGLGRAHALALARAGATVVVNDLGVDRHGGEEGAPMAKQVADEIVAAGGKAVPNYDSVSDPDGAQAIAETATAAFGRIDILVNNAGILRDKTFRKMTKEMWDPVIDVHLTGTFLVTKACLPAMLDAGGASIINTTSLSGLKGNFGQANYAAAKAGVWGFTHVLALELGRKGIRANCIAPMAKTRMTEELDMVPDEMDPAMIAPLVVYLASDLSEDVNDRCFGCHGSHYFEYRMQLTDGVDKGDRRWSVDEIAERIDAIGAERAAAETGSSADDAAEVDQIFENIGQAFMADRAGDWSTTLHFEVKGTGIYTVRVKDATCASEKGAHGEPDCKITFAGADVLLGLIRGEIKADQAFMSGKIKTTNMGELMRFSQVFDLTRGAKEDAGAAAADEPPRAVNAALVGKRYYGDAEFAEPAAIERYADAIRDDNPLYRVAAGDDQIAPPIFAVRALHNVAASVIRDSELGIDVLRLLHGEQDMRFHRAIRPWDILTPRAEILSIDEKRSGTLIQLQQRLLVSGQIAVEAVSGYFVRHPAGAEKKRPTSGGKSAESDGGASDAPARDEQLFRAKSVLEEGQTREYAAASKDDNPIHTEAEVAEAAGLPSVIGHGLWTMAQVQTAVVDELLDRDPTRLQRLKVRFSRPVFPGDELTTTGTLLADAPTARVVALTTVNGRGEAVITDGIAEIAKP